jgi:homoserine dehydrogenase
MKQINIGIVGFGTVGTSTAKILLRERARIRKTFGLDCRLAGIAETRPNPLRGTGVPKKLLTRDYRKLVRDPNVHVIAELVGGTGVARQIIAEALRHGKHVVTANKALLAEHGGPLFALAEKCGRTIGFEGAVCGGIPVIRALKEGLSANRIISIFGILNGTANFVLSKMRFEGRTFRQALTEAQRLGIAEQDPSFDVEGTDSAHKISILASLAFGRFYHVRDVHVEGITNITALDIRHAADMGFVIKLLAVARLTKKGLPLISVAPTLIPIDEIIAEVNYVYNGVFIEGDSVDHTLYTGKGAGGRPTGSAVVSDIVHTGAFDGKNKEPYVMYWNRARGRVLPIDKFESEFYIRLKVRDKPGVMARISGILGRLGISIGTLVQTQNTADGDAIIVIRTHNTMFSKITKAVRVINRLSIVDGKVARFRIIRDLYNS